MMNLKTINLIGPGKVGLSIFNYFISKGFNKGVILDKDFNDYYNLHLSGITFIGVPDDEINNIVLKLKNSELSKCHGLIHFSGLINSTVFNDLNVQYKLSLHPNMPFNTIKEDISSITWGIEGNTESIEYGKKIVEILNGDYIIIPTEKKTEYHLAAVISSNFSYALQYMSDKIYKEMNIEKTDHLIDLAIQSLINIKCSGLKKALTGPVKRDDLNTIIKEGEIFEHFFENKNVYNFMIDILYKIKRGDD